MGFGAFLCFFPGAAPSILLDDCASCFDFLGLVVGVVGVVVGGGGGVVVVGAAAAADAAAATGGGAAAAAVAATGGGSGGGGGAIVWLPAGDKRAAT